MSSSGVDFSTSSSSLSTSCSDLISTYEVVPQQSNTQTEFDIPLVMGAIQKPGDDEFSGQLLLKLHALLYCGKLYKRINNLKGKQEWKLWDSLPLASVFCHGSRVLIEFENNLDVMKWLFDSGEETPKNCKLKDNSRMAATHGISLCSKETEEKFPDSSTAKKLKELKVGWLSELGNFTRKGLSSSMDRVADVVDLVSSSASAATKSVSELIMPTVQHYGVNIALGGVGNQNPRSKNKIENNGQHGHVYIGHYQDKEQSRQGLLVGIEQSAPGESDQNGNAHSILGTSHEKGPTGGELFTKSESLKGLGPDYYYDGIFLNLQKEDLEKAKALVSQISEEKDPAKKEKDLKSLLISTGDPNNNRPPSPKAQENKQVPNDSKSKGSHLQEPKETESKYDAAQPSGTPVTPSVTIVVNPPTSPRRNRDLKHESKEEPPASDEQQVVHPPSKEEFKLITESEDGDDPHTPEHAYSQNAEPCPFDDDFIPKNISVENKELKELIEKLLTQIKDQGKKLWEQANNQEQEELKKGAGYCKDAVVKCDHDSLCKLINWARAAQGRPSLAWKAFGGSLMALGAVLVVAAILIVVAALGSIAAPLLAPLAVLGPWGAAQAAGLGIFSFVAGYSFFNQGKATGVGLLCAPVESLHGALKKEGRLESKRSDIYHI